MEYRLCVETPSEYFAACLISPDRYVQPPSTAKLVRALRDVQAENDHTLNQDLRGPPVSVKLV